MSFLFRRPGIEPKFKKWGKSKGNGSSGGGSICADEMPAVAPKKVRPKLNEVDWASLTPARDKRFVFHHTAELEAAPVRNRLS